MSVIGFDNLIRNGGMEGLVGMYELQRLRPQARKGLTRSPQWPSAPAWAAQCTKNSEEKRIIGHNFQVVFFKKNAFGTQEPILTILTYLLDIPSIA